MTRAANLAEAAGSGFAFRNRIINGAMMIDQRNAGAAVTPAGDTYLVDRFAYFASQTSKFTWQQNKGSVTPPAGFSYYLGGSVASAVTVGASDYFGLYQTIEGANIADLGWGSANAQTVTLSFKVYSSLTGTFGGSLRNGAGTRFYPFSYTISTANTWTNITITIPGETTGAWVVNNGTGIQVVFALGFGSNYTGPAGSWANSVYYAPTGATSVVGTNGATFYITGVQLEKGSVATPFEFRPYGAELALCQRYYQTSYPPGVVAQSLTNVTDGATFVAINNADTGNGGPLPVTMRATPTFAIYSTNAGWPSPTVRRGTDGANMGVTLTGGSATNLPRLSVGNASLLGVGNVFSGHYIASAEL